MLAPTRAAVYRASFLRPRWPAKCASAEWRTMVASGNHFAAIAMSEVEVSFGGFEMSEPVAQVYLNALALCEAEGVATLWVHDPLGLFPQRDRPEREL